MTAAILSRITSTWTASAAGRHPLAADRVARKKLARPKKIICCYGRKS